MSKELRGILIDVDRSRSVAPTTLDGTLEDFYEVLNCDCIDIVTRKNG